MLHIPSFTFFLVLSMSTLSRGQTSGKLPSVTAKTGSGFSDGLTSVLRNNNLTQTATFVEQQIGLFLPILQSPGPKTFLAPTDNAWQAKNNASIPGGSGMVELLSYHLLNDTVRRNEIPRHGFDVQIVPTMFNATNVPVRRPQVVVLTKNPADGSIEVLQAKENVSFTLTSSDGPQYENILIQPIDQVLTIPSNVPAVSEQLHLEQVSALLDIGDLSRRVNDASLITLFAPTQDAITKAIMDVATIGTQGQLNTVLNHIINGTSIFSTEMPAQDDHDAPNAIRSVISAAGQELRLVHKDGRLRLMSGSLSANIVRSDILLHNGVVHLVDAVLINTKYDEQSAAQAEAAATEMALQANKTNSLPGSPLWGYGKRSDGDWTFSSRHNGVQKGQVRPWMTAFFPFAILALHAYMLAN